MKLQQIKYSSGQLFKIHYLDVILWSYKTVLIVADTPEEAIERLENADPETIELYFCENNIYDITRS